jgi:hemolysin III
VSPVARKSRVPCCACSAKIHPMSNSERRRTIARTVRTKAQVRPLGEEIASAMIQGAAAAASVVGLEYLVMRAWPQQNELGRVAMVVYGASMFIAFLTSALYHGVQHARIKPIFEEVDQCTIFLFIAGTYTPFTLLPLWHHAGGILLASIWTLALAGIVLRLMNGPLFQRVAISLYLAMGWLCLGWGMPLYQMVGTMPILLMVAGGVSYTGGLLLHRSHRLPFSNPAWHLCVVAGSTSFFFAIARIIQQ